MSDNILLGLGINAALLLGLAVLYENLPLDRGFRSWLAEVLTGILVGLIGVMVMLTPWRFVEGVVFDTRSVLISVTGLFFGPIPTLITVLMTAALRVYQGGGGMFMGVAVIVVSAALGLLWRHYLDIKKRTFGWLGLYIFGVVVHLAMLMCASLLPRAIVFDVLKVIAAPVMLIYPVGVVLLGLTLQKRDQRIQLAQDLNVSHERYKALFEYCPIPIWEEDFSRVKIELENLRRAGVTDFRAYLREHPGDLKRLAEAVKILDVNKASVRMAGAKDKEETKRNLSVYFRSESWEAFADEMAALAEGQLEFQTEITLWNLRGESGVYDLLLSVQPGSEQTFARVLVSFSEITERKQAEEQLRFQAQLLNAAGQAIIAVTTEGKVTYFNRAAEKLYGWSAEEARERNIMDIAVPHISKEQAAAVMKSLQSGESWSGEFFVQRKDGSVFPAFVVDSPIRNPQGNLAGIVGISQDITEIKKAEEEIKRLNENLEKLVEERTGELREAQESLVRQEKLAALGQMAGGVGHELRNPLGVISNAVYYLKMAQSGGDEKTMEYLDLIEKQVNVAGKIVSDLLDFTRVKSAESAPVSIPLVVGQTLQRFPAPEHVRVILEFPAGLSEARADPQHVIQTLGNLILNAVQAMPDSSKDNQLAISARVEGDMICVSVEDNGVGIPPENIKRLFEPLFTTKIKGIGLGLAVSRKLMESNGGRIEARSEVGKGSVFEIYLPIYRDAS